MPSCGRCGQENPEIARFCLACGAPLVQETEERRVVTVLFVDLVGFTARAEQLDPEDARAILRPYYERVRREIESFGGTVEKFVGDAVFGIFGAPTAYGDDAERAVRAAIAVRDALTGELETRIAVNTGEAIVALGADPVRGEAMVAGDVVNTASRLQAAAPVNGILVGAETFASTRGAILYRAVPPVVAKGKSQPLAAWLAVDAASPAGERVLSRALMVGRARDLDLLSGFWRQVATGARLLVVTILGAPGIGKSRLGAEFAGLVELSGGRVIKGRSLPYGGSAYASFAQQVKQVAGIFDSDDAAVAADKLGSALDPDVAEPLATLLGLAPDGGPAPDRETLFFAARRFVEGLSREQPTLLMFEDLQWADSSLLDLIETLGARVHDVPVLLLALARPELLTARPMWGGGLPAYIAMPLEPLTDEDARLLAVQLLAGHTDEDAERLARLGEGNPLFIEELAAALAERSADSSAELPTTIRSIISARLDALPAEERSLLLDAAVVGKIFWRGALARLVQREDQLGELLDSLEQRDLIRREPVSRFQGDQQFIFKHMLIRDVAYATVPRDRRRERHGEVARFLEDVTPEVGESADALAQHWREAGDDERALPYLLLAADHAGRGWAKDRALALYTEALGLVPEDDVDRRREIQRRRGFMAAALWHVEDVEWRRPEGA